LSPMGPIEAIKVVEEMYDEYKSTIEDLIREEELPLYKVKEYPPTPFESYARVKFRFREKVMLRFHYLYPYSVKIDDKTLNLIREVKVLKVIPGPVSRELITFKAKFLLFGRERTYHTEDVMTPTEVPVEELWITISVPTWYSRFTAEFIQKKKFWVEIRTY